MLRFSACLALAALFGVSASTRERRENPPLDRLLSTPDRWEGAEIRLRGTARAGALEVDGLLLPVRGPLTPGEDVELRGTFRRGGLDLASARPLGTSTIPALVLLWALWNLRRHFQVRR